MFAASFATVGALLTWKRPGNPIGWLLSATGLAYAVGAAEPVGATGPAGHIFKIMASGGVLLIAATGLAAILSLAFRYRRARTAERAQLRWLVWAVALVPVAIGIAVLRYRLYDIDRVICRTLAYAIITGLLAGSYAGLVLLATQVVGLRTPVAVAISTLAAAALFSPVRRRVQRVVDRRFNRARYDADMTVAAPAACLKDAVDLDAVRDDLAGVVQKALEPAHISVWLSQRG